MTRTRCGVTMLDTIDDIAGVTVMAAGYEWECPQCGAWNTIGPECPTIGEQLAPCATCGATAVVDAVKHPTG